MVVSLLVANSRGFDRQRNRRLLGVLHFDYIESWMVDLFLDFLSPGDNIQILLPVSKRSL